MVDSVKASSIPEDCTPSVMVNPGESEFTRILRAPNSCARTREITSTAPLVALYTALPGGGVFATTELMLITEPPSGINLSLIHI